MHTVPNHKGKLHIRPAQHFQIESPAVTLTLSGIEADRPVLCNSDVAENLILDFAEVMLRPDELEPPRFGHA